MKQRHWIGLVWLVVVLSYVVPYTLLTHVQVWYGSLLFWSVAGALVIVLNVIITKDFRDEP